VASSGSWTIIPTTPTDLRATATPRVVLPGASAVLDVTLSGAPDDSIVDVAAVSASGVRTGIATMAVKGGHASLAVTPIANTTYQVGYAGGASVAAAQAAVMVLVRRTVVLLGRSSSTTASARLGHATTITASIGPAAPRVPVSFRLYRLDRARRAWVYAGSHGRTTDQSGRASYTWAPSSPGSYYWRVTVASTPEFANNVSPVYRWNVSR
jgi:hypothetical protein